MIHLDEFKQYGKNAINQAINVCSQNGGGDILIPKGRWKSGAIHLKSNIHIHIVLCGTSLHTYRRTHIRN